MRTSLAEAARDAGIAADRFRPVSITRWRPLLDDILTRFTTRGPSAARLAWLWEDLRDPPVGWQVSPREALGVLRDVLPERQPVWFLSEASGLEHKKHGNYWVFETDTDAIVGVLGEHFLFEYYVVARDLSWMVGETHHGTVYAVGEPVSSRLVAARERSNKA